MLPTMLLIISFILQCYRTTDKLIICFIDIADNLLQRIQPLLNSNRMRTTEGYIRPSSSCDVAYLSAPSGIRSINDNTINICCSPTGIKSDLLFSGVTSEIKIDSFAVWIITVFRCSSAISSI